ncbi:hypothetical protein [Leptospira neocaledonica]|uniref:Uncharacterized protein n=1 Tax=Leptospira neocaledonica TaxID=2023192 RepID=A0A2M9ZTF5_9LEPT|nr:hypothetical protein [Leptospira neocaledonica]PJZ75274.1 hypothetical protein CH365_19670 [Leptospira neocaledonica]
MRYLMLLCFMLSLFPIVPLSAEPVQKYISGLEKLLTFVTHFDDWLKKIGTKDELAKIDTKLGDISGDVDDLALVKRAFVTNRCKEDHQVLVVDLHKRLKKLSADMAELGNLLSQTDRDKAKQIVNNIRFDLFDKRSFVEFASKCSIRPKEFEKAQMDAEKSLKIAKDISEKVIRAKAVIREKLDAL